MLGNDLSDNARFLTDVRFAAEAIGNEAIACPKTNVASKPIIKDDDTNCRDKHPMCRVRCNHEKREERLIENMFFSRWQPRSKDQAQKFASKDLASVKR